MIRHFFDIFNILIFALLIYLLNWIELNLYTTFIKAYKGKEYNNFLQT